ncbi:MAG: DUF1189 family protein [Candidatus Methylacidiphilales bacterium]|nr:DUF1189 family protein [Candidatus Methylacidiphilales bacterium]
MFLIRYLSILARAFYSRDLYNEVAWKWTGSGFLFLLPLCALSWIPITIQSARNVDAAIAEYLPAILKQIPPGLVLRDGQLIAEGPGPYVITGVDGEFTAVIDPEGRADEKVKRNADLVVTKEEARLQTENDVRHIPLKDISEYILTFTQQREISVTPSIVEQVTYTMANGWKVALYPLGGIAYYFDYIFRAILLSFLAVFVSNLLKRGLYYQPLLRVTIVAMVPAMLSFMVIQTVAILLNIPMRQIGLISTLAFALSLLYVPYAVQAVALPSNAAGEDDGDDADEAASPGAARLP